MDKDAKKAKREALRAKGVSLRGASSLVDDPSGFSRANLSRLNAGDAREAYDLMHTRDLGPEKIVAVQIDTTFFPEFRTYEKKVGVMVATGITAYGRKLALAIGITQAESAADYRSLIDNFIARGVSPDVLFTADASGGMRKALADLGKERALTELEKRVGLTELEREKGVTDPEKKKALEDLEKEFSPPLQSCTTHGTRNVGNHIRDETKRQGMPEEKREEVVEHFRKRIYGALTEDDPDIAVKRLDSIADELSTTGYVAAAKSLKGTMNDMVTVQRLGIGGQLRSAVRSTNLMESINDWLKRSGGVRLVSRWTNGEMALHHVALALMDLERDPKIWTRLPEPEQLVAQLERAVPDINDLETILETLPPSMTVTRLSVLPDDHERTRRIATQWFREHPGAIPIGSPRAIEALGLDGDEVTPDLLSDAMECRDPVTGTSLRDTEPVPVKTLDHTGDQVDEMVEGIFNTSWRLVASPSAMREWRRGGEAREKVEARLMEAASAAVERETLTTRPWEEFVGVAALQRPTDDGAGQALHVAGITIAVRRGKDGKFKSPATKGMFEAKTLRAAEDEAKVVLTGRPREVAAPVPDVAPSPPADAGVEPAAVSPQLLAAVSARALELAPSMVTAGRKELQARAADFIAARRDLGAVAREVSGWQRSNWRAAARQIAAAALWPDRSSGSRHGIWGPLDRGHREVLGEMRSQWLLGDATFEVGRAEGDAAAAGDLRTASGDALAGLAQPIARVEAAAQTLAARHELIRRSRFRAAQKGNGRKAPSPPELRDSRGVFATPPIHRLRDALGPERAAALDRYAQAVGPELRELNDHALQRLAAGSAGPWKLFEDDVATGVVHTGLERTRDIALGKLLEPLLTAGRETGAAEAAVRREDGIDFIKFDKRAEAAKQPAGGHWEELRDLEERLAERRQVAGSPEGLIEEHPKAVIYHAAFTEFLRREREREPRGPNAEPAHPANLSRGKDAGQINQRGMAIDEQRDPVLPRADDDRPASTFPSARFVVTPAEAGTTTLRPSPGDWRWIGEPDLLGKLGVAEGAQVDEVAYRRVASGRHAQTDEVIRKATTVRTGSDRVQGLAHMRGGFSVPAALAAWRDSGPAERKAIGDELIAETKAVIGHISGTDRFLGAATVAEVGEGTEATIAVDWVALGADRGKGIVSAHRPGGAKDIGAFGEQVAERLRERFAAGRPEIVPERPAAGTETGPPRVPGLPTKPLRDSLAANRGVLGDKAAVWIKEKAEEEAAKVGLHHLSDEELRRSLPARDPFEKLPKVPGDRKEALDDWWGRNGGDAVRTVAIEDQLIDNATRGYAALAERESARRGTDKPNPLAAVREARGEEFAAKVERHAAVLASDLDSMPERDRGARTAALRAEIRRDGLGKARFDALTQAVALQHSRNVGNERAAAARLREPGPAVPDVGAAIG